MLVYRIIPILYLLKYTSALYSSSSKVIDLTASNFEKKVLESDSIWIVEFFAPYCGHCQKLVPEYEKAAKALNGIIKVGAVDATVHGSLGQKYKINGYPTIKIFGLNKNSPSEYNGPRSAISIVEAGLKEAEKKIKSILGVSEGKSSSGDKSEKDVIELTDSNFDELVLNSDEPWMVEYFAPWCGHCKNLAPHWSEAAKELKGKVKFGALDATVHQSKALEYNIKGYPTIKFFPAGKKTKMDAVDYDGGRTKSDIAQWVLDKYTEYLPAPEVKEVVDENVFKENCEKKPLCVVSILPHILDCDSKCRNKYIDILHVLADKYKQKDWGWIWSEGGAQLDLEQSLELGGFGYPAMAAVNFKKMKSSTLKGSFSKEGINEFLRDISFGRGQTVSIRGTKLPKINKNEPWDGKDGVPPEQEDIDLSDVELDEKRDEL